MRLEVPTVLEGAKKELSLEMDMLDLLLSIDADDLDLFVVASDGKLSSSATADSSSTRRDSSGAVYVRLLHLFKQR